MTKLVLTDITNPNDPNSIASAINANNTATEQALENTLSRDGSFPNQMGAAIDMNSHRILNLPQPLSVNEPLRLKDLNTFIGGGVISTIPAGGTAGQVLFKQSSADYDAVWANAAGTVTSVALAAPADFIVTNSPVTSSGTLTLAFANTPTGTGGFARSVGPTLTGPTIDQIKSASVISFLTGAGSAQGINTGSITVSSTYNKTPPTNGIWTDGGVAFAGSSGSVLLQGTGAASGVLTLPNVTATLVGDTATQTLTNKTLTTPVIGSGGLTMTGVSSGTQVLRAGSAASGTITVPAGTYSVVGDTLTQTLFSKSISGGGLTFLGSSSGSTVVVAAAAATGTMTIPAVSGTDGFVALAASQTLTNKTISGASNTLTNLPAANISGNMQVTNFNGGTGASGSTFLRGDMTWATPAGGGSVTSVSGGGLTITGTGTLPYPFEIVNHSLGYSASAGALTINLLDNAGNTPSATSPVTAYFRNGGGSGAGAWQALSVTSALSLTIPSGATMGVTSSTAFRLWVVLFNDGGTPRLGVVNCRSAASIFYLNEGILIGSTALSGSSNSTGVLYTQTSAVTSKAFKIVGYLDWNTSGVTAGTWTTTNLLYNQPFSAGIPRPGTPTGNAAFISSGGSTTTSTSMVDVTGATVTIAPASAANLVRFSASGSSQVGAAGAGTNSSWSGQMLRASTVVAGAVTTGVVSGGGTNMQSNAPFAFIGMDWPNSTAATYKLQHLTTNTSGTANTFAINILVEEIQG